MPFDAGQEGAATGVDDGATTLDDVLELKLIDEDVKELRPVVDDEELEPEGEEVVAELEEIVEVLNEVIDGVVLELVVLELLMSAVEEAIVLIVVLAPVDTELDVVAGRIYPATLVLRRLAVLTKD